MEREFIYIIPESILLDSELNGTDLRIYMFVRSFADNLKPMFASNGWIAEKCNVAERNVQMSLKKLEVKNYIERRTHNGKRTLHIVQNGGLIIEEGVTKTSPPHDENITPPHDENITHTISKITKTNINNINKARASDYKETYFPMPTQNQFPDLTKEQLETFDIFMDAYPVKKNENRAKVAWFSQKCFESFDEIMKSLNALIAEDSSFQEGYAPNPDNWILNERWKDKPSKRKPRSPKKKNVSEDWDKNMHLDLL